MEIKKRPVALALAGVYAFVDWVVKPIWESWLQAEANVAHVQIFGRGHMINIMEKVASYIPGSFPAGFVCGSLLFAYWDLLVGLFRRLVLRVDDASDMIVWVGSIVPYLRSEQKEMMLVFSVMGLGREPVKIVQVDGYAILTGKNGSGGRRAVELGRPYFLHGIEHELCYRVEGHFGIAMSIPAEVYRDVPDMFWWSNPHTSLSFDSLNIWMESKSGLRKRLPIWDSMRLTTGDDQIRAVETFSTKSKH